MGTPFIPIKGLDDKGISQLNDMLKTLFDGHASNVEMITKTVVSEPKDAYQTILEGEGGILTPPIDPVLAPPTNVTASTGADGTTTSLTDAYIEWTFDNAGSGITYILQYRRYGVTVWTDYNKAFEVTDSTVDARVGGLQSNTVYEYQLQCVKGELKSVFTTLDSITTWVDIIPPGDCLSLITTSSFKDIFLVVGVPIVEYEDIEAIEVWRADTNDRGTDVGGIPTLATKVGEIPWPGFTHLDLIGTYNITRYYWVRARDMGGLLGNWYPLSSTAGVSGATHDIVATDINDFAIDASKMFINIPVVAGDPWHNNTPGAGSISWDAHQLYFNGVQYDIAAGNTALKYVYWTGLASSYGVNAVHPADATLLDPKNGFIIAVNISGTVNLAWRSVANQVIGSAWIMNLAVLNAHINDLSADKINAGTILARPIKSATSGARVEIFPDANTGLQVIDDGAVNVLQALVGGTDVGDVTVGDYANSKGLKWDKSTGTFYVRGALSAIGGGPIVSGKYYSNLRLDPDVTHGDHKLRIQADWVTVKNSTGLTAQLAAVDVTNDIAVSGPTINGRDRSADFATATWIYFYIIHNPITGVVASLSSVQSTGPVALPTDYTYWFKVGVRRTINTNIIRGQTSRDEITWCGYDEAWNMVLASANPADDDTYESLSIASAVPPTAKRCFGHMGTDGTNKVGMAVASDWSGVGLITLSGCEFRSTVGPVALTPITNYNMRDSFYFDLPLITAQTLYWAGSSITVTDAVMIIYGWVDDV